MELARRFIFGDSACAKATGLSGAATRADLGLAVVSNEVRNALWPSHMSQIKAVMDDNEGRFGKQELLAHIFNNSLGRPILFPTDVRAVGVALDNACTRQKKETKAAKAAGDAAIRRGCVLALRKTLRCFRRSR